MRKLLTISIVMLAVCTQTVAQSPEELIAAHKSFGQAIENHDVDALISHFAEDGVWDATTFPAPLVTPEQMRLTWTDLFDANPDWHSSVDSLVFVTGNIVVAEHASLGTNTRDAGGKSWIFPHLDIFDFEGTKIKRLLSYGDYAGILVQLGWAPEPEMPQLVPTITVPDPEATGLSPMEANTDQIDRWNSHDPALVAKVYHADAQIFAGPLGMTLDRNATTAMNEMYYSAFPDVKLGIVRAIDLGEGWVVTELVARATHQASFMGVPPAGYPTDIRVVWLTHYDADGLVTKLSFYYDNLTLINQMTTAPWPLDGIWITAAPTPLGNLVMKTLYVAQDAGKTQYSGTLEFVTGFPLFAELYPDANPSLFCSAGGQAVMVGRNKYEATYLQYNRKFDEGTGTMEIVGIDTLKAYFEVIGPNQLQGYGTSSYYLAAQDADLDGFPDEGEAPAMCVPWQWTSKRLTSMSECVPTP